MIEIIPAIDIIDGRCVRLSQGDYADVTTYRERPEEMVRRFVDNGLCRIHAVDLDGAKAGHPCNMQVLDRMMSASQSARIEWGGGLKTDDDLRDADNAGASYMVIGSVAVREPLKFNGWLARYGADRMVLGADVRNGKVAVSGWLDNTDVTIDDLLNEFLPHGLSQSIVTDISRDGMLQGPNFALYERLQHEYKSVDFTVSGGISSMADIERCLELNLRRVIVGKALYEGRITLNQLISLC